jgi:putative FmdB family regulatory protein
MIMPIYEYQCKYCQHSLDALQKMSDAPLTQCPACQQSGLDRLVSAAGFQLKGTGWYATDFKAKPKEAAAVDTAVTPSATAAPTTPSS